jgi:hypothetical protein
MNEAQLNAVVVQPPASVASTATTTMTWDCLGYDYATVRVLSGTQATTDPAITTVKFLENDTNTNASNMVAIVPLTGGTATSTSAGFVIPAVTVTGVGAGIEFQIDLRKRKRYMQLNITPGTTLVVGAIVTLSRAGIPPLTAAAKSEPNMSSTNVTGIAALVQV